VRRFIDEPAVIALTVMSTVAGEQTAAGLLATKVYMQNIQAEQLSIATLVKSPPEVVKLELLFVKAT
jgi:hypothetical protein